VVKYNQEVITLEYEIIYSDRRTLSLNVKGGALIVRAPRGAKRRDIEKLIADHTDWIEKHLAKREKRIEKESALSEGDVRALKKNAKKVLSAKTEYYASIMGLKYGRITITSAKTRFGSCSSKGNISFSYRLMLYPEAAQDYVVVHELAHLVEMNHSPRFYAIVARYLPDYKQRAALLKK
jgi:predicted metal-dependent hydrolase